MQPRKLVSDKADMEVLIPLGVRVPRGLKRKLKQAAVDGETSVQAIVILALSNFAKQVLGK